VTYYIIKLIIMLPIIGGMIFGALWLYRKYQPGLAGLQRLDQTRDLRITETMGLGVSGKLAVVEFSGQKILIAVTRNRIDTIARSHAAPGSASAPFPPAALAEPDRDLLGPAPRRSR